MNATVNANTAGGVSLPTGGVTPVLGRLLATPGQAPGMMAQPALGQFLQAQTAGLQPAQQAARMDLARALGTPQGGQQGAPQSVQGFMPNSTVPNPQETFDNAFQGGGAGGSLNLITKVQGGLEAIEADRARAAALETVDRENAFRPLGQGAFGEQNPAFAPNQQVENLLGIGLSPSLRAHAQELAIQPLSLPNNGGGGHKGNRLRMEQDRQTIDSRRAALTDTELREALVNDYMTRYELDRNNAIIRLVSETGGQI